MHKKFGKKPLVERYPNLIEKAVNFIKLHEYSAHARTRNSSGSSGAGVSVDPVRQHLIKTVPGLTDISKTVYLIYFAHQLNH